MTDNERERRCALVACLAQSDPPDLGRRKHKVTAPSPSFERGFRLTAERRWVPFTGLHGESLETRRARWAYLQHAYTAHAVMNTRVGASAAGLLVRRVWRCA